MRNYFDGADFWQKNKRADGPSYLKTLYKK
jgi:hypothetical protein